jgi:hypothetical protein
MPDTAMPDGAIATGTVVEKWPVSEFRNLFGRFDAGGWLVVLQHPSNPFGIALDERQQQRRVQVNRPFRLDFPTLHSTEWDAIALGERTLRQAE